MGKISANLIRAKQFGEQMTGATEKFAGFGKKHNDPTYRLKVLAKNIMLMIRNIKRLKEV